MAIGDDGEIGCSALGNILGKIKDENASSYYWRSSLPVLRSYHTDPKFTAFGILDVLSTVPKKDMVEEEKVC